MTFSGANTMFCLLKPVSREPIAIILVGYNKLTKKIAKYYPNKCNPFLSLCSDSLAIYLIYDYRYSLLAINIFPIKMCAFFNECTHLNKNNICIQLFQYRNTPMMMQYYN